MTNAWSLLYDELNMEDDKIQIECDDAEVLSNVTNSHWIDTTDYNTFAIDMSTTENRTTENRKFKYSEDRILKELKEYIVGTYNQHYSASWINAEEDKIQTLDLIEACGDGESFCRGNILKYASRYDKKGTARRDIMKILHYAILLMHFNDKNASPTETYPQ